MMSTGVRFGLVQPYLKEIVNPNIYLNVTIFPHINMWVLDLEKMITTDEFPKALEEECMALNKEDLLGVMLKALDLMQQYNGRSIAWCVTQALKDKYDKGVNLNVNL